MYKFTFYLLSYITFTAHFDNEKYKTITLTAGSDGNEAFGP